MTATNFSKTSGSGHDPLPIRLIDLGVTDDWRTQAVYHTVAEQMRPDSPDTIVLCRPRTPYLCLGYHQAYDAVLDRHECRRRKLPVLRRRVGGGTTYLDRNQLFYQCIFHHQRVPVLFEEVYARLLSAPVAALQRLGLDARLGEINEIVVDGRRVAGTGGGRIGEAAVVVGNLLFDFDYSTMAAVWRVPWPSFRELAAAALPECVTTLRRLIGNVSIDLVQAMLLEEFVRELGRPLEPGRLTAPEKKESRRVAARLASDEYLDLHRQNGDTAPMDSLKISAGVFIRAGQAEIDGCRLRGSFRLRHDIIEEARLDSEPPRDWTSLADRLRGVPFVEWRRQAARFLRKKQHGIKPDKRLLPAENAEVTSSPASSPMRAAGPESIGS